MLKATLTNDQAIYFSGLEAPVLLKDAAALLPVIEAVLPTWPFRVTDAGDAPDACMTVTGDGTGLYRCDARHTSEAPHWWDAVNAVCEMIVMLAWEQIAANPSWLCLHCAAVEFNGRLVLFPNRRRSGKSTLTAVLAQQGYRVFTDDFLPVTIDETGTMQGFANGIRPRLRVPVSDAFTDDFRDWVADHTQVSNDQYAYLDVKGLAPRGTLMPIGAIVILDRHDAATEPALTPVEPVDVLDDLITQNFARLAHSGRILRASQGVAQTAAKYRLQYQSAQDAVACLAAQFQNWDQPAAWALDVERPQNLATQGTLSGAEYPAFDHITPYQKAPCTTETRLADTLYVADRHGFGIHKLNDGSRVIWEILEEQASLDDVVDIVSTAFPDQPKDKIMADCTKTLQQFLQNHLIMPAGPFEEITP